MDNTQNLIQTMFSRLHISDFDYPLQPDRIAHYPAAERDLSKVLLYNGNKPVTHDLFRNIVQYLDGESLLVFNNTRVIHARILFRTVTGSTVEIFCLRPWDPSAYEMAFRSKGYCIWECLVGNLRRWKENILKRKLSEEGSPLILYAEKLSGTEKGFLIKFSWSDPDIAFSELIEKAGLMPLPPYIKRQAEENDTLRYQTVYAQHEGSVAAPTAGLHFTENLFRQLKEENIQTANLTLHVGAGTFLPVKSEKISDHPMHSEHFSVGIKTMELLMHHSGPIVAVGTTSVRTMESLYWLGVRLIQSKKTDFELGQWDPYQTGTEIEIGESLQALYRYMIQNKMDELNASTRIMIVPGYHFKLVKQLITNFHQPKSTLLLLVAAFIGDDWKKVYRYALENDFRFLSYGDSSFLTPGRK
jgi:S-adenosylmethionine:tRNA ribosyltransferase-isomerase